VFSTSQKIIRRGAAAAEAADGAADGPATFFVRFVVAFVVEVFLAGRLVDGERAAVRFVVVDLPAMTDVWLEMTWMSNAAANGEPSL
jgi:hypothetical protein